MDEKNKEKKERFSVGEVATQTAPVIVDTKTNETYQIEAALAKILNALEDLKGLL